MTAPIDPDDRDLEARLQASWQRSVAHAEDDLRRRDVAAPALAAGHRPARRPVAGAALVLAVIALAAVALAAGQRLNDRQAATTPTITPPAVSGSPAPSSARSVSPGPSASPDEGIPVLDAGQTFPPAVDGQPVVPVGPEAAARIAAATDDSPFYLSGWLVDGDRDWTTCTEPANGVPAPSGTLGSGCIGRLLRATAAGGTALRIFATPADRPFIQVPGPGRVQQVLVQVHVRDPRCVGTDCARMAVLDRVVMEGAWRVAPGVMAASLPSGGISAEQAVDIARRRLQRDAAPTPGQLSLLSVSAGTGAWLDEPTDWADRWLWVVRLASADGYTSYDVTLDYTDGTVLGTGSGPVTAVTGGAAQPGSDRPLPSTYDGQPVVAVGPAADARIAAATDDTPFYVSGWLIGSDPRGCRDFNSGVSGGVGWADCAAIQLRETASGGATLLAHVPVANAFGYWVQPGYTRELPALLQVHVHDPRCTAADCERKVVFDRAIQVGAPRIAVPFLATTMPADGISMDEAVRVARQLAVDGSMMWHPSEAVLLSAEAGPAAEVDQGGGSDLTWIWAVTLATADGIETYTFDIDYRTATSSHAHGGSLTPPSG